MTKEPLDDEIDAAGPHVFVPDYVRPTRVYCRQPGCGRLLTDPIHLKRGEDGKYVYTFDPRDHDELAGERDESPELVPTPASAPLQQVGVTYQLPPCPPPGAVLQGRRDDGGPVVFVVLVDDNETSHLAMVGATGTDLWLTVLVDYGPLTIIGRVQE